MSDHDPTRCPGAGCPLDGRVGTCEQMRETRQSWRWCRGWAAYVCPAAMQWWRAHDKPALPDAAIAASTRRVTLPHQARAKLATLARVAPEVRAAPEQLDAWTIYAPHEPNAREGFHDEEQRAARGLATSFDVCWKGGRRAPDLTLLGREGTGKTYLCLIMGRRAAAQGWSVGFVTWHDLVELVKASRAGPDRIHDVLAPLAAVDLLILDDVRPIYGTQDDENIAHALIAARHGRDRFEGHRPTLVTANLTRSELADVIGPAALSRLLDGGRDPLVCDWPSWRALPREALA